jgi:hypothetical protein
MTLLTLTLTLTQTRCVARRRDAERGAMWEAAARRLRPICPPARSASARASSGQPLASASLGQLADVFWRAGPTGLDFPHLGEAAALLCDAALLARSEDNISAAVIAF